MTIPTEDPMFKGIHSKGIQAKECVQEDPELEGHPFCLLNFRQEFLSEPGVYVGLSMVSHSPVLEPAGARQVVDFLSSLPHPSLVLVTDALNRHNVRAMAHSGKRKGTSDKVALEVALKCGDLYVETIQRAIDENSYVAGTGKITVVRWQQVMDEKKVKQDAIVRRYYETDENLRKRIDEIAMAFLLYRRPECRHFARRLPHLVNYLLGELPMLITGMRYEGQHYPTPVYPSSTEKLSETIASSRGTSMWKLVNDIHTDSIFVDFKEELIAADDGVESRSGVALLPILRHPPEKKVVEEEGCPVRNLIRKHSRGEVDHEAEAI